MVTLLEGPCDALPVVGRPLLVAKTDEDNFAEIGMFMFGRPPIIAAVFELGPRGMPPPALVGLGGTAVAEVDVDVV